MTQTSAPDTVTPATVTPATVTPATVTPATVTPATVTPATEDRQRRLEDHRVELTGYCYRMLGSGGEAEDAVQETMLRAWRAYTTYEGRASLRSWLYRIATNVCFDMLSARARRARPMDLGPCSSAADPLPEPTAEADWLGPAPDARTLPGGGDPAETAVARDSVRLAFVAALQHLPPRQRAVLILRDVLRWQAAEVADLLESSVASVNSALQRARASLAAARPADTEALMPDDADQRDLLNRYVDAFIRYDIDALVALLHSEATMTMPPFPMWLRGPAEVAAFMLGPGTACRGSRVVAVAANGMPAFAQWKPSEDGTSFEPWAVHVLEIRDGRIVGLNFFIETTGALFAQFGLPRHP